MNKTTYGLNNKGVIEDKEWFWGEVELRAINNYGDFRTGEQVEINVNQAIQEIADEANISRRKADSIKLLAEARDTIGAIIDGFDLN